MQQPILFDVAMKIEPHKKKDRQLVILTGDYSTVAL